MELSLILAAIFIITSSILLAFILWIIWRYQKIVDMINKFTWDVFEKVDNHDLSYGLQVCINLIEKGGKYKLPLSIILPLSGIFGPIRGKICTEYVRVDFEDCLDNIFN
ncbi:MAG: hypothetical protein DRN04_15475, partial [Thermoprotei archaeon]